jgi:hypothetical protein
MEAAAGCVGESNAVANGTGRVYLRINPDIVATLEGLAPQGAGQTAFEHPACRIRRVDMETEWPI